MALFDGSVGWGTKELLSNHLVLSVGAPWAPLTPHVFVRLRYYAAGVVFMITLQI